MSRKLVTILLSEIDSVKFWSRVDKSGGPDACWPWMAGRSNQNYGVFKAGSNNRVCSRIAWTLCNRELREGELVRHSCDNPPCCNPAHLLVGSDRDNINDMMSRNRQAKGERNGWARLTERDILGIREASGLLREIASKFGIPISDASKIRRGQAWAHVGGKRTLVGVQKGEERPMAKLTENQVREIRSAVGSHSEIAAKFGVNRRHIGRIKAGITWRHLWESSRSARDREIS